MVVFSSRRCIFRINVSHNVQEPGKIQIASIGPSILKGL